MDSVLYNVCESDAHYNCKTTYSNCLFKLQVTVNKTEHCVLFCLIKTINKLLEL